jgi:hypothetical protein
MAARALLDRINTWSSQHPWKTILILAALGIPSISLIPPRENPIVAAAKIGLYLAIMIGINLLRYRTAVPSQQQIDEDERRADEIAAAVRRRREQDSLL